MWNYLRYFGTHLLILITAVGLLLGGWFLYTGVRVALDLTNLRARSVLLASVIYLPLIYGLMVFDPPTL